MRTRICGATIVMPARTATADLWIEDERIAAIGERPWTPDATIDAAGCYIFPGGIDPHVHMGFTVGEFTSTDSFATGSRAAAFGGVTTILDFAVPEADESISAAVQRRIEQATGEAAVDYGIHAVINRIPEDLHEQIRQCIKIGTPDFKTFTTYVGLQLTSRDLLRAMRQVSEVGGLIMVHAEEGPGNPPKGGGACGAGASFAAGACIEPSLTGRGRCGPRGSPGARREWLFGSLRACLVRCIRETDPRGAGRRPRHLG